MENNINVLLCCFCHINRTKHTMLPYYRCLDEFNKTCQNMRDLVVQYNISTHGSANTSEIMNQRHFMMRMKYNTAREIM